MAVRFIKKTTMKYHRTFLWLAACDICGKQFCGRRWELARTKCCEAPPKGRTNFRDLAGQFWPYLLVVKEAGVRGDRVLWECICTYEGCGRVVIVRGHDIVTGNTRSCGCVARKSAIRRNFETYRNRSAPNE